MNQEEKKNIKVSEEEILREVEGIRRRINQELSKVFIGQEKVVEEILITLLSRGHALIMGVPGLGKTLLVKSLAQLLSLTFSRIQFTPDLMPSDITGTDIIEEDTATGKRNYRFLPGPIFANIILADEINRTPPKTQAALLEAMEERQITVDGQTHPLPEPFLVLATQNPIEYEGTFPLPEAQMDRFLLRIHIGYPENRDEIRMLEGQQIRHPIEDLGQVVSLEELLEAQRAVRHVTISDDIKRYIVDLVDATRSHPEVYLGASPRGSIALFRASQALAGMQGRDFVLPDDVKRMAVPALAHRLIVGSAARIREVDAREIVQELLERLPVPGGEAA